MSKKSIQVNYIYNFCYQVLVLITPLLTSPYLARVLGADGVGTSSYIESIASYFVLFATMGITTFGQREISYVQENYEKRTVIFWETKLLSVITSIIAILAYLFFCSLQKDKALYIVIIFNIISVLADVSWFFQGIEEFKKIVGRNAFFKILNIIFIFVFIRSKKDLLLYMFGHSLLLFLCNISLWTYLPKYVGKPVWSKLKPMRHFKEVFSLFIPTVAVQIYTVFDKTMIGIITKDAFENGYYEQAMRIIRIVLMVVTSLGTVLIPRIGFHFQKKEIEQVNTLMYQSYRFVWLIGIPLCFGVIGVAPNFVPWFFGDGYEKVIPLLRVLSFTILAIGISNVTGIQYLVPTNRQNILTKTVLIGAGVNFILNLLLIPILKSIGAAIASLIAETVITIVQLFYVRMELSGKKIVTCSLHYVIAGSIMLLTVGLISNKIMSTFLNTVVLVLSGAMIYICVLFIFRDEFLFQNLQKIIRRIDKQNRLK